MRRAMRAFIISGVLFSMAACGTATGPTPGGAAGVVVASAPAAGAPAAEATTRSACEALGQVYSKNMAPFAEALAKMVAAGDQAHPQPVQQSLKSFATAISAATQSSTDPQVRADGKQTADRLQAKAKDTGFFRTIKTTDDVNKVIGPTLKEWLSPVTRHCS